MASLKDLRNRIRSVQSTRKITSAMKVVAASRLKKAQDAAEASRPYAVRMERMLASLAQSMAGLPTAPPLLAGTGKADTHLVIIAASQAASMPPSCARPVGRSVRCWRMARPSRS